MVTVNPTPVATPTNTAPIICSGDSSEITLLSAVVGTTFEWTVVANGTGAVDGVGVVGDMIHQELVNTTQTPVPLPMPLHRPDLQVHCVPD